MFIIADIKLNVFESLGNYATAIVNLRRFYLQSKPTTNPNLMFTQNRNVPTRYIE